MEEAAIPSKIDLRHADEKIIFLICDCSLHKDYSFWKLTRDQAERFIGRLKYIETLTWSQFSGNSRDRGLTTEKPGTDSFEMIDFQNTSPEKIVEKYYFHFRIEQTGKFRIFGYQKRQFFCITHIDRDGEIHH
ncbi:MAG: hypothetical protein Q8Q36_02960 [bacterium]|nr:hypothetical protein [bacterium]